MFDWQMFWVSLSDSNEHLLEITDHLNLVKIDKLINGGGQKKTSKRLYVQSNDLLISEVKNLTHRNIINQARMKGKTSQKQNM